MADGAAGADPVAALSSDVRLHVAVRVDPPKGGGGGGGGATARRRFLQAYKARGLWDSASSVTLTLNEGAWPFEAGKPFFLRLTLDPRGCFTYVNGRAMAFTRHPSAGAWAPAADPRLHVMLPVAGDAGEKATWRVLGAWWGHCAPDREGLRLMEAAAAAAAAAPKMRLEAVPGEVYVTGLRPGTLAANVAAAFAHWGVTDVRLEPKGGAAVVRLGDADAVTRCINETDRRVAVLGALLNVRQAHRQVAVT
jgi:hypothetical protein